MSNRSTPRGRTARPWAIGHRDADSDDLITLDSNYTCRISVPTADPPIEREVTAKNSENTRFLAFLTPAETATMEETDHLVYVCIENTTLTVPMSVEYKFKYDIEKSGFPTV